MAKDLHRYGIVKHHKGDKYENDCLMLDKNYRPLDLARETAEMMIRQFEFSYSDEWAFRIKRLD